MAKKKARKKRVKKKKIWTLERYLIPASRKIWFYSPLRRSVAERAQVSVVKGLKTYRCEKCRKLTEKIQVDHIEPIIDPFTGFQNWDVYFSRMFCNINNLQAICESCHKKKSEKENKSRRAKKAVDKLAQ